MTSNNLQFETDFHAEANSHPSVNFTLLSANKVSAWHV